MRKRGLHTIAGAAYRRYRIEKSTKWRSSGMTNRPSAGMTSPVSWHDSWAATFPRQPARSVLASINPRIAIVLFIVISFAGVSIFSGGALGGLRATGALTDLSPKLNRVFVPLLSEIRKK